MSTIQNFYNQLNRNNTFSKNDDKFFGRVDLSSKELILAKVTLFARGFLLALVLAIALFPSAYFAILYKNADDKILQTYFDMNREHFAAISAELGITSFGVTEIFYVEQLRFIQKYWRLINF